MLKPIPKKTKKIKSKSLDKQLMALWAHLVKLRANYICEYPLCRKSEYLNSHHIVSRSNKSVRYEPDNGICLCAGHHTLLNTSAHKDPFFKEILIEAGIWTQDKLLKLRKKSNEYVKWTKELQLKHIDYLKSEIEKYDRS